MDAGEDLAVGAGAVVKREFEQLVGLFDRLAGLDLHSPKIRLAERVKVDLFGKIRLNLQRGKQALELLLMELFEFRQRFFRVHTREDGVSLVDRHGLGEFAPYVRGIPDLNVSACPDLREDLLAGRGDERKQQRCADADRLKKVIHDRGKARLVGFVFCKRPRHRLVDILVGALDALEDLFKRVLELELFHLRFISIT